tara:strand:- start:2268 stop:3437 length:1170 start_codon:yes stop_codon:yes gene_type:complete
MPAKSKAQRKFMGMVRATQKGEMKNPSPELKRAAGDMSAKAVNKYAKTKEKNLPDKVEESVQNNKVDLVLKTGVNNVLKQDNKDYDRGLLAQVNKDGSYDVAYWYDKYEKYPVEVVIDGKTCAKDAKNIHIKYHPELKNDDKEEAKEDMKEYVGGTMGYGAVISNGIPGAQSHSNTRQGKITKKDKKKKFAEEILRLQYEARVEYTGPNKDERKQIKKLDNKKFAAKLADYEKNMDPKKRQALRDKATKGMKFVHEEGAPTMNTGSTAGAAGFSSESEADGPTAGLDEPLGGTRKLRGRGAVSGKKKKFKCKKAPDGINKVCESTEAKYLSFLVQMDDVEFIFNGKSPADVKIRLRKIYRPERLKGIKITRMLPAQVMHYYWEKRQAAM